MFRYVCRLTCTSDFAREKRIPPAPGAGRGDACGIPPPCQWTVIGTIPVGHHGGPETQIFQNMVPEWPHDFLRVSIKRTNLEAGEQELLFQQVTACFRREESARAAGAGYTKPRKGPGF